LAKKAKELDPENPTAEVMFWKARFARRNARNEKFQMKKDEDFIRALENAGRAAIPADDNRNEADKKIQIEKSLTRPISLHYKNTPLSEVVKHIATDAGINVVVDNLGLAEAGVKPDQAVTIDVENVKLSSALQLILKPLELGFM